MGDEAGLRGLHSKVLDRKPGIAELPDPLRDVAMACGRDESDEMCVWGQENLSDGDWEQIREAQEEERRREAERAQTLAACQAQDEETLGSMYPGRLAFYERVASPPPFEPAPVDAVVAIGISGNLVSKAKKVLEREEAREALKVQYGTWGPNKFAGRNNTERLFYGYYTPEIEARMAEPRPECDPLRHTPFIQAACRRDLTVSIVRDWLETRGHRSVRFIVTGQSSWPEYALLFERRLPEYETRIDSNFDKPLKRESTFLREMCRMSSRSELWLDYESYVRTLLPDD